MSKNDLLFPTTEPFTETKKQFTETKQTTSVALQWYYTEWRDPTKEPAVSYYVQKH